MTIVDKIKLPKNKDRRKHLTDDQKRIIRDLYFIESWSIRKIAREYQKYCSRRLIQFILFPERDEKLKEIRSVERRHLLYYDRDKHSKAVKNLREYKREIYKIKKYNSSAEFKNDIKEYKRINNLIN